MLGEFLEKARTAKRISQSDLAQVVRVKQSYISGILSGKKTNPSREILERLAGVLGLKIEDVFREAGLGGSRNTPRRPVLIGICGGSGAGKTWLCNKMRKMLKPNEISVIELDRYYKPKEQVEGLEFRHDNPLAVDFGEALTDIIHLKDEKEVHIPIYNYDKHQREPERELRRPTSIIIVEGHLLFHDAALRKQLDIKIWVDTAMDICLSRRIRRDCNERGRDYDEVLTRYYKDVKPAYLQFIRPLRRHQDLELVNEGDDPHAMPLFVSMILAYIRQLPYAYPLSQ